MSKTGRVRLCLVVGEASKRTFPIVAVGEAAAAPLVPTRAPQALDRAPAACEVVVPGAIALSLRRGQPEAFNVAA